MTLFVEPPPLRTCKSLFRSVHCTTTRKLRNTAKPSTGVIATYQKRPTNIALQTDHPTSKTLKTRNSSFSSLAGATGSTTNPDQSLGHKSIGTRISLAFHKQPRTYSQRQIRAFTNSQTGAMADDASYTAFLTRANQDVSSGGSNKPDSTSQARSKFDPSVSADSASSGIPAPLTEISTTYTSDTDSEFEPVFFNYASDDLPSVDEFTTCLGTKAGKSSVEELSLDSWDSQGSYGEVVEKVKQVGNGKGVKVFRVELDKTRIEYYVVTVGERKLIGVVAKAVES